MAVYKLKLGNGGNEVMVSCYSSGGKEFKALLQTYTSWLSCEWVPGYLGQRFGVAPLCAVTYRNCFALTILAKWTLWLSQTL